MEEEENTGGMGTPVAMVHPTSAALAMATAIVVAHPVTAPETVLNLISPAM